MEALAGAGADAIEVGIPFSDPMIDGPTIQEASLRALERGTTPDGILADLSRIDVGIPLVVMTYYNLIYRAGHARIAGMMSESGVVGAIIPDLPLEEVGTLVRGRRPGRGGHRPAGGALDARRSGPGRVRPVARLRLRRRPDGGDRGAVRAGRSRPARWPPGSAPLTELPVCVGIGVSTPEQAVEVCQVADGVVVGSALVRRLLEGAGPEGAADFVASLRRALDAG